MNDHSAVTGELERLLDTLESGLNPKGASAQAAEQGFQEPAQQRTSATPDAIDTVLASPMRTTAVRSLRTAPEVEAFRQALTDGLIRADTANQLLRLVNEIVTQGIR